MDGMTFRGQRGTSLLRWAALTVPAILLLGFASGMSVPAGNDNPWYQVLAKPALTPPGWVFPVAWTTIYVLMGLALAIVLSSRRAPGRGLATALFVLGFAMALAWMPLFFGARRIDAAFLLIAAMIGVGIATAFAFARIRILAAWLMVPYLVWISFAAVLTWRIGQLNPDAEALVPKARVTQML